MKLLPKTKWAIVLIVVVTSLFSIGVALADYMGPGYFGTNQMYRCHSGSYATQSQNASARWSASTDLDNYYSCSGNNITTVGQDYGANNRVGYAYICSGWAGCDSWLQQQNTYTSCEVRLNTYYLSGQSNQEYIATHELGHCWSLAHDTRSTSIMNSVAAILNLDSVNISEVNARY